MKFYFIIKNFFRLKIEYLYLILNIIIYSHKIWSQIRDKKIDRLVLFYDLSVSSVAYGDFFYATYLLKLLSKYKQIELHVICDKLRSDFYKTHPNRTKEEKIQDLINFSKNIFIDENQKDEIKITKTDWHSAIKILKNEKNNVLFYNCIKKRRPIYKISYNIINLIYKKLIKKNRNNIFLSKNINEFNKLKIPTKDYITIGTRIDYKNELNRNIDPAKFKQLIELVKKKFPRDKIFIVSDYNGCLILEQTLKNFSNIYYSKNYSKNFYQDGLIILNSKFYLQVLGSGISVFAEHSEIPYELYADYKFYGFRAKKIIRSNFMHFQKSDLFYSPWQLEFQKKIHIDNLDHFFKLNNYYENNL